MFESVEHNNLKTLTALVSILFLLSFSLSLKANSEPVAIKIFPENPQEGQPIVVKFDLNNPTPQEKEVRYELFANGAPLTQGSTLLSPGASRRYTYIYTDPPKQGERITFLIRTESNGAEQEKSVSIPSYPPQVWSSFVSFASFSTSLMGSSMGSSMSSSMGTSISSMQFYKGTFADSNNLNVGLTFSLVLITLLVFLELSEPVPKKSFQIAGLRLRFTRLSVMLFIVFAGMVLTKVVLIIG